MGAPFNLTLTDADRARLTPGMRVRIPGKTTIVRIDAVDRTPTRYADMHALGVLVDRPHEQVVVNVRPEGWPYHGGRERPSWYRGFPALPLDDLLATR